MVPPVLELKIAPPVIGDVRFAIEPDSRLNEYDEDGIGGVVNPT